MGGTRFVGKPLVERLQAAGHALTLFTRGNKPAPAGVEHLVGDRSTAEGLQQLEGRRFDVIVDSSGRTLEDSEAVIARTGSPSHRFVYVSSAGVYADSELWPLDEDSPTDPASRHAGKLHTEEWLRSQGIAFTSFRPTYIVGPGNYNPVESWFFDRIVHGRPVPLPGDGSTITQLGHVSDLAAAMARCIEVDAAAEYYLDHELEKKVLERTVLTFGDNLLLFELPFISEPAVLLSVVFQMQTQGYRPVLAHPERYAFWHNDYAKYERLKERGVLFQLNLVALSGAYGPMAKEIAERLIDDGHYELLGSDCHNMNHVQAIHNTLTRPYLHKLIGSGKLLNAKL